MTQEEKARAYDKAIERARLSRLQLLDIGEEATEIEYIFPELKGESEDERISKEIIKYLEQTVPHNHRDEVLKSKEWIAWLEKQDEQKTAEKIEPFDKYEGLTDFERTLADICIGWIGEEFGWKQYIKDNADVLLKIAVEKFNSVQDVPFEQNPATSYCQEHCKGYQETGKCFADGDCKDKRKAEQKSAWSKEDEVKINRIVACLENLNVADNDILLKDVDWLKSLKTKVQPKQEWSEEDEEMLRSIMATCELAEQEHDSSPARHLLEMQLNWLKSLKQRIGG